MNYNVKAVKVNLISSGVEASKCSFHRSPETEREHNACNSEKHQQTVPSTIPENPQSQTKIYKAIVLKSQPAFTGLNTPQKRSR